MRLRFVFVCAFGLLRLPLLGLEVPAGGEELKVEGGLRASASEEVGQVETLADGLGKRISITQAQPAKPYGAQFTAPLAGLIEQGQPVLALIKARVTGAEPHGELLVKLQQRTAPYTAFAPTTALGIHREWLELPVTLVTDQTVATGQASLVLLCAHQSQQIEVASIRVLKYSLNRAVSDFPKAKPIRRSYPGREPDAAWRKAALERIEQQRKADLSLTLTDAKDQPLPDTELKLVLRRHEFGFGSAVVAKRLVGETEDDRRYREVVDRLFSVVVFENDLKDGNWSPDFDPARKAARNAELDAAFGWLSTRHISVRGHYLMQVPTPYNLHQVTDSAEIRRLTLDSVRERLAFVRDRVIEWDVINHPIAWASADMLNQRPGLEQLDREVFRLSREKTKLPFFVNEDQVFRPGPQCDDTFSYIQALNQAGLSVAGLGNQAHFDESYLPSPEHLLAVTDRFSTIVPRQSITEFDIVTREDEALAADYTRDVLIAVFSHPAYTSFLLWGFWEGSHWKPEAASWNRDWSIRPRGAVLEEWIGKRWRTELTARTDAAGQITFRGFPGWYEVKMGAESRMLWLGSDAPKATLQR
jgi:endo-1,4-beta-xylanase